MKIKCSFEEFLGMERSAELLDIMRGIKLEKPAHYIEAETRADWSLDKMDECGITYFILHKEQYKNVKRTKAQQKALDQYNKDQEEYYALRGEHMPKFQKFYYDELVKMGVIVCP
jgi:hypothetical protein